MISVIIPTFRPGNYINTCLDSFCAQTIQKELVEIILVLNGDKEPFFHQLTLYAEEHAEWNIRLLHSQSKGVSNARNLGIQEARGEFIVFADDDDWVSPSYLKELYQRASSDGIVLSNVIAKGRDKLSSEPYFIAEAFHHIAGKADIDIFEARSYFSVPVGKIIPRQIIDCDLFPTDFSLGEDALFMFAISRRVRHITTTSPDATYFVWLRPSSASRSSYTYGFRVKLALRTAIRYTTIFLKHPRSYHFTFFLSRIVATLRKLFQRNYQ